MDDVCDDASIYPVTYQICIKFCSLQDKMEQLKMCQIMDGTIITYPKLTAEWLKIPPQITVEGRPKRQRPTHLGVRDDEKE